MTTITERARREDPTRSARQQRLRDNRRRAGLKEVRLMAHPDDVAALKALAADLADRRRRSAA